MAIAPGQQALGVGNLTLQTLDAEQFAATVVLTRAAFETSAALWYLDEKVETALTDNNLGDLDDCVVRLLCGTYKWEDFPDPSCW